MPANGRWRTPDCAEPSPRERCGCPTSLHPINKATLPSRERRSQGAIRPACSATPHHPSPSLRSPQSHPGEKSGLAAGCAWMRWGGAEAALKEAGVRSAFCRRSAGLPSAASLDLRERLPNLSQGEAEVFGNLSGLHTRDQRCAHCPALGWMEQRPSGTLGGVVSARMSTRQPSQGYLGLFKGPAQVRGGPHCASPPLQLSDDLAQQSDNLTV